VNLYRSLSPLFVKYLAHFQCPRSPTMSEGLFFVVADTKICNVIEAHIGHSCPMILDPL